MKKLDYAWLKKDHGLDLRQEGKAYETSPEADKDAEKLMRNIDLFGRVSDQAIIKLIDKHPDVLDFIIFRHNNAILRNDNALLAEIRKTLLEEHSEYVYAVTNVVLNCDDKKYLRQIEHHLGPNKRLTDFRPGIEGHYYLTQFDGYERAVIRHALMTGDLNLAKERLDRLVRFGYELEDLEAEVALYLSTRSELHEEHSQEKYTTSKLSVTGRRTISTRSPERPTLQNPELELLYREELDDMTETGLDALLALPRKSLIADLRSMLREAIDRYDEPKEEEEFELPYAIHAASLLGALGAEEAQEDLLDYFRMEFNFIEYWAGDFPEIYLMPALVSVSRNHPEALLNYLREPNVDRYSRAQVIVALTSVYVLIPAQREKILRGIKELIDFFLAAGPDDGIIDGYTIGSLITNFNAIDDPELLERFETLYDKEWVDEFITEGRDGMRQNHGKGFYDNEIIRIPTTPIDYYAGDFLRYPLPEDIIIREPDLLISPFEGVLAQALIKQRIFDKKTDFDFTVDDDYPINYTNQNPFDGYEDSSGTLIRRERKVGRNEPCPCGSGKKYKKCCI